VTEAEVRARIISFTAAASEPVLTSADVDILVSIAKRRDDADIEPSDANWTPTWDVYYAVAQGWLMKAGRTANRYLFMSGGKMFSRNQYWEHCIEMCRYYGNKRIRTVPLGPDPELVRLQLIPVLNNWNL